MKEQNGLFDFESYKPYLAFRAKNSALKGFKSQLAEAAGIQSAYLSQVLHGQAHLSLEQAQAASHFLKHTDEETHYFLLLVQKDRAGTSTLEKYFETQLSQIRQDRLQVSKRLAQETTLGPLEQAVYYSSWLYAAVHMTASLPEMNDRESIAEALRAPPEKVAEVLDFLLKHGLLEREGSSLKVGPSRVFLGKSSSQIQKHHANWRLQALDSLDRETDRDLHYSSVFTLAKSDLPRIKDRLLEVIKENLQIIQASKEEELFVFNLDFFDLRKVH